MSTTADLSVLIVSFNTRDLLRDALRSLLGECREAARDELEVEVLVLDNASRDGSADMVAAEFPEVRLVRSPSNLGFAAANNRLFPMAGGRLVALLNPDARLRPGTLRRAIERMDAEPGVGAAGGRLVGSDGSPQPSARQFPSALNDLLTLSGLAARFPRSRFFGRFDRTWADATEPAEVDWVPGAFLVLRREVLAQVGHFDEDFFLYYEEVDLCRRIRAAGHSIWYWPDLVIEHVGGASAKTIRHLGISSAGAQLTLWRMRSALLYHRKHHGAVGAWLAATTESAWHAIRARRHARASDPGRRAKHEESSRILHLMEQAWRDTFGGVVSPPRPW